MAIASAPLHLLSSSSHVFGEAEIEDLDAERINNIRDSQFRVRLAGRVGRPSDGGRRG